MTALAPETTLRIGEVAERLGLTTRTIRYYEELGLLAPTATRSKGSHRLYSEEDVSRLGELIRLRDLLGLSLDELALLAEAEEARAARRERWDGTESSSERLRIIEEATGHVERQLELVRTRRGSLDEFETELLAKLQVLENHRLHLQPTKPPRRKGAH